ncbi:MAG: abortive infection family protein [Pasteurella sp.]|nr:abortive infection family protein [Pasteurella sp.]
MASGAPGTSPEGNCETKCREWFLRCNNDQNIDALEVLGKVIQDFMDNPELSFSPRYTQEKLERDRKTIIDILHQNQLEYQINGFICQIGTALTTKKFEDYVRSGNRQSIKNEFDRAIKNLNSDPHASITAASSMIEAICKVYIESNNLTMPSNKTIMPLWKVVQQHLHINPNAQLSQDQNKIYQGLISIVDGIRCLRTHIGSAHGRGINIPQITIAEARLAVNGAYAIVMFIMDMWQQK